MNREIKFRAWDGEKMTYDWFAFERSSVDTLIPFVRTTMAKELMQYIGLKDKNGVEIYEGDILESNIMLSDGRTKSVVKWLNDCACFIGNGSLSNERVYMQNHQPVVIGNFYQNPELLKN